MYIFCSKHKYELRRTVMETFLNQRNVTYPVIISSAKGGTVCVVKLVSGCPSVCPPKCRHYITACFVSEVTVKVRGNLILCFPSSTPIAFCIWLSLMYDM